MEHQLHYQGGNETYDLYYLTAAPVFASILTMDSAETRMAVLTARAGGESIDCIAKGLRVTRERVRQIEAKYVRKFAVWYKKTCLIERILETEGAETLLRPDALKPFFGRYTPEMTYLLNAYKNSFYYSGTELDCL